MAYKFNPFTGKLEEYGPVLTGTGTVSAAADGAAGSPGIAFANDLNTGIYRPGADQIAISTGGTGRLFVDASGRVGIGTTSPTTILHLQSSAANAYLRVTNGTVDSYFGIDNANSAADIYVATTHPLRFFTNSAERVRIDSSGRLLVGTSSAPTGSSSQYSKLAVQGNSANAFGGYFSIGYGGAATGLSAGSDIGTINFTDTGAGQFAQIRCDTDATTSAGDFPGRLVFSTTADVASSPTERMRITSSNFVNIGTQGTDIIWNQTTVKGVTLGAAGVIQAARDADQLMLLNRITDDGTLVTFAQDGTAEGNISISGTTVSYNGAHLSRWSQLSGGAPREEILRGTVLSNIDEMCEWGDEDNEQLNRMKVSDVEGDPNVSGVFQAWDDDDDTYTDDFYCAMTGDFIIRISAGIPVHRGQLLMSAGDGTAKPQDDDIVRSKTIAKVTSNHVTCTYDDGSYCVPCVLMAC